MSRNVGQLFSRGFAALVVLAMYNEWSVPVHPTKKQIRKAKSMGEPGVCIQKNTQKHQRGDAPSQPITKRSPIVNALKHVSYNKRLRKQAEAAWREVDAIYPELRNLRATRRRLTGNVSLQRMVVSDCSKAVYEFNYTGWASINIDHMRSRDRLYREKEYLNTLLAEYTNNESKLVEVERKYLGAVELAHACFAEHQRYSYGYPLYIDEVLEGRANTRTARVECEEPGKYSALYRAGVRKGVKKLLNKRARKAKYTLAMADYSDELSLTRTERDEERRQRKLEAYENERYEQRMLAEYKYDRDFEEAMGELYDNSVGSLFIGLVRCMDTHERRRQFDY